MFGILQMVFISTFSLSILFVKGGQEIRFIFYDNHDQSDGIFSILLQMQRIEINLF